MSAQPDTIYQKALARVEAVLADDQGERHTLETLERIRQHEAEIDRLWAEIDGLNRAEANRG